MNYYVYVLLSKRDKQFYLGMTNHLKRRLRQHRRGENISTAHRLPVKLIFYEVYLSKVDAMRREKYLKTAKGKTMLRYILRDYLRIVMTKNI